MRPIFRLLTEFPGVGGLHHSINIRVCSYLQLLKSWDYATVVIGFVITAFFLYYLVEEFIEFDKMGLSYFWSIWSILDIIVIALALAFVILHIVRYMLVSTVGKYPHSVRADGTFVEVFQRCIASNFWTNQAMYWLIYRSLWVRS